MVILYSVNVGNTITTGVIGSNLNTITNNASNDNLNNIIGTTNTTSTNLENFTTLQTSNVTVTYSDNTNINKTVNGILPNAVGDVVFPSYFADANNSFHNYIRYNKDIELAKYSDGKVGTIEIENANLYVKAYDYSDIYESIKKGVGHMDSTAYWE